MSLLLLLRSPAQVFAPGTLHVGGQPTFAAAMAARTTIGVGQARTTFTVER